MQNSQLSQLMKQGMRRLAAGVCVLSMRTEQGEPFAMTVSSVTSVSDNPASLLVCINQQVSQHSHLATLGNEFAINILSHEHQNISNRCAGREWGEDRFAIGNWTETAGGLPYLVDAQAVFLCRVDMASVYGTHHIVVGLIHQVILADRPLDPLIYIDGRYAGLKP